MVARTLSILILFLTPLVIESRHNEDSRYSQELRNQPIHPYYHYHSKRHMLPTNSKRERQITTRKPKEYRRKPTGYLKPLHEDDMENEEIVSVAVGPPVMRPKYERKFKIPLKFSNQTTNIARNPETDLIKDILVQLGREFVSHQVNEDFVFGQYVGNSMKNLTSELRLQMQLEILDLIFKYQKLSNGNIGRLQITNPSEETTILPLFKELNKEKKIGNETDEMWPEFNNLAKIVG